MTREISSKLDEIVHEETQSNRDGFDLTVNEVYLIESSGRIDFGGGELTGVDLTRHESEKKDEGDDYEWWNLDKGMYLVEYNENLENHSSGLYIQPRIELLEMGAIHPSFFIGDSLPNIPVYIGGEGIHIKENARISTLKEI